MGSGNLNYPKKQVMLPFFNFTEIIVNEQKAIKSIIRHIELCNQNPTDWYVGITDNIKEYCRIHGVRQNVDAWISKELNSEDSAIAARQNLLDNFGMECESTGNGRYVISYQKNDHTNP